MAAHSQNENTAGDKQRPHKQFSTLLLQPFYNLLVALAQW